MNARDRGVLINKLADLMDQHKEELATIESIGTSFFYHFLPWHANGL